MSKHVRIQIPHDKIAAFCLQWKISELSLFGSVLREELSPDSDIDVLVRFSKDASWSLFDYVKIRDNLASILGRDVDLIEVDGLRNPFRRSEILRTRQVIYAA